MTVNSEFQYVQAAAVIKRCDESATLCTHAPCAYPTSKAAAERLIAEANSKELATVTLRPLEIWKGEPAAQLSLLVPGGRLVLTTPSHGRLRLALHGIERYSEPLGDHLHLYTRRSLAAVLGDLGFDRIRVRALGGVPPLRRMLVATAVR